MEAKSEVVETPTDLVWIDESRIVRIVAKPHAEIGIIDARASIATVRMLLRGRTLPLLVDITGIKSMNRDARLYFSAPENAGMHTAIALVTRSPVAMAIGNFFIGLNHPNIPTRLFTREAEAVRWLGALTPTIQEAHAP